MFTDIVEYIKLSREFRRSHLDLDESCIEIGGNSKEFRALLAHTLKTTIPIKNRIVYVCHACHNDKCSNPKHLYWGTPKDNTIDQRENGTWKPIKDRMLEKYTEQEMLDIYRKASMLGGKANKGLKRN